MKTYRQRTNEIKQKLNAKQKEQHERKQKRIIKWTSVAASMVAVALIFTAILFAPYPVSYLKTDLSAYKGSEYYDLIIQLDSASSRLNGSKHTPKNFLEAWFGIIPPTGEIPKNDEAPSDNEQPPQTTTKKSRIIKRKA